MQRKRVLQLFYVLAKTPDTFYRSIDLAKMVNVTDRTVKSDIKDLEDFASQSGAEIVSQKGKGYKLLVCDNLLFNSVFEQIEYYIFSYETNPQKMDSRTFDILRMIIDEKSYMTVDDIADRMYLSKSSITNDMNEVNRILNDFNLTLKKKNEDGPFVKGNELNKRLLMLYLYENSFHDAIPIYINDDFATLFAYDDKRRKEIRHILLHELRKANTIIESIAPILARYMCLLVNRYKNGNYITFTDEHLAILKQLEEVEVAKKVIDSLKDYEGFDVDINEIYALAVLIASYSDLIMRDNSERKLDDIKDIDIMIDNLYNEINLRYHIDFNKVYKSRAILAPTIAPMLIQKHFGISKCDIMSTNFRNVKNVFPVSALFASYANKVFVENFNCELSEFNIYCIAVAIQRILFSIDYEVKPVNAMVVSGYGINSAYIIYDIIKARYGGLFNKLDCYELYEPREIPLEDYDWVIGNIPDFSYRYDWPLYKTDAIPTQQQINGIYNEVALSGLDFKGIIANLHYESIDLFEGYELSSLDTFYQIVSYKLGKDMQSIKNIMNGLQSAKKTVVVNETMIIFIDRKDVKKSVFEIYALKNKCIYQYNNVKTIIVLTLDVHNSLPTIRFMNDCLYMMCIQTEECIKIVNSHNLDGLNMIVKIALKALPISLE